MAASFIQSTVFCTSLPADPVSSSMPLHLSPYMIISLFVNNCVKILVLRYFSIDSALSAPYILLVQPTDKGE